MTRLLIVSDSFGNISKLDDVVRKHKNEFDILIHLGNRCYDALSLQDQVDKMILIRGNMELASPKVTSIGSFEEEFDIEGVKVFATHGHRYSISSTFVFLKKQAKKIGANIVLFGHTREKKLEFEEDVLYFNPGSLMNNEYGIIAIENGEISEMQHAYLSERW